jgi:hypothetical protein
MGGDRPPGPGRAQRAGALKSQPPGAVVDPGWLSLRGPADARARTKFATDLTEALAQHLSRRGFADGGHVRLVDVGAGAGAGARWLGSKLPFEQDWRLVDHDPRILAAAARPPAHSRERAVVAGVEELPRLLSAEPAEVVTCQALLDVLTADEVDIMVEAAVACEAAVLLGLSVTGTAEISPRHPDDDLVGAAFDAHQRRAGRLGPEAGQHVVVALRGYGYGVTVTDTPWHLGPADSDLTRAWLQGRADAALEQEPGQRARITRWLRSREATARRGGLDVVVGHVDVLGLPPDRAGAA